MDLTVIVHGDDPDDRHRRFVASEQHCSDPNSGDISSVGQRRPAEAVVVLGVEICDHIEFVEHLWPPLATSVLMIRVDPHLVPTRQQRFGPGIEIVEQHGEVTAISAGRFEADTHASKSTDGHDRQLSEPNQR